MNSIFALSFGLSLIIVGIFNIWFETTNIILLGLSLCTFIFSVFNMIIPVNKSKKLELLYIIPFILLISIFCYSNSLMSIEAFYKIVNGNITNVLTFISFGLLFVSVYMNYIKEKKNYIFFQKEIIKENFEIIALINSIQKDYMKSIVKNKQIIDDSSQEYFGKISKLCTEKFRQSKINMDLLSLNKEYYTISDFNHYYQKNNDTLNIYEKIEKYKASKKKKKKN